MALSESDFYAQAKSYCTENGYKPGWIWYTFKHTFGHPPAPALVDIPAAEPTPEFFKMIAPGGSVAPATPAAPPPRPDGWLTAQEIVDAWHDATGVREPPTMVGQILARDGLHRDPEMRMEKIPGRPALYSPAAQQIIFLGLEERESKQR